MSKKMKPYTVVGLYKDNKQVWVGFVEGTSVPSVVAKAKREVHCEINVLAVFEGDHRDVYGEDEIMED